MYWGWRLVRSVFWGSGFGSRLAGFCSDWGLLWFPAVCPRKCPSETLYTSFPTHHSHSTSVTRPAEKTSLNKLRNMIWQLAKLYNSDFFKSQQGQCSIILYGCNQMVLPKHLVSVSEQYEWWKFQPDFRQIPTNFAFISLCLQVDPPPSYDEVVDKAPRYSSLFQVTDSGELVLMPTATSSGSTRWVSFSFMDKQNTEGHLKWSNGICS
jgi:hypothetical protein